MNTVRLSSSNPTCVRLPEITATWLRGVAFDSILLIAFAATTVLFAIPISADAAPSPIMITPRVLTTHNSPLEPFDIELTLKNPSTEILSVKTVTVDYPSALVSAGLTPRPNLQTEDQLTAQPLPQTQASIEHDVKPGET